MFDVSRLQWETGEESSRTRDYGQYEAYYDGDHTSQLPGNKLSVLQRYTGFRANICDVIVDALAERLIVSGFNVSDPKLQQRAREIWAANRMDETQSTVHTEAIMAGNGYVLVDVGDDMKPRINYNPAEMISIHYADAGHNRIVRAEKRWKDNEAKEYRKTIYFPDHIERYSSKFGENGSYKSGQWQAYPDAQKYRVEWTDKQGKPLGVPIIPFRNKSKGKAYGRSELLNVIPLQDAINKTLVDLMLVLDNQGWSQRWTRGKAPPGGWKVGPGIVWSSDDPKFEAGELAQASPDGLLSALDRLVNIAAGRSRTPQHLFHIEGEYPSGEALKTAETGLFGKVRDRQTTFGNSWEDVMLVALHLDQVFNDGIAVEGATLETVWADTETKNDLMVAQAVSTKAPWLSHMQVLRELGYTDELAAKIIAEYKQDQIDKNELGGQLIEAFGRGALPGDPGTGTPTNATEGGGQATTRNPDR